MCDKLFHDLRRSACKNAIGAGLSERITMALCGHKTKSICSTATILWLKGTYEKPWIGCPENVPVYRKDERVSTQTIDNIIWRRIGAGVPPGLQIQ